ncbi:hypothetical protein POM88_046737 [Heracleum sosnowskyi]|uniref:Ion transport domain-containing protein n=1 Tax=Heracleum sosnowskyi TaxID=360622 RepID=A0AAD8H9R3_9APIA|nr:hypothetical protein POM88_046737 [Heracleum sosnowskyi]
MWLQVITDCRNAAQENICSIMSEILNWYVVPAMKNNSVDHVHNTLVLILLIQYVPRLFVMFPLNQRIIKTTGVIANTAWARAAYNLVLYMLASYVLGAAWYLMSIGRQHSCWRDECYAELHRVPPCNFTFLDCHKSTFKFGMFSDAFTSQVATSPMYQKYLYSLWWGLRNLSSYGQNLQTSTYIGETLFCILLSVAGLVLFAQLIGNMQVTSFFYLGVFSLS